ncbi:MAG TPA: phosphatidate cytidylyltransferase [Candidatus Polarisedimenticolaceae bacterium]|jgi:phosphatidate cytidylyltransferase
MQRLLTAAVLAPLAWWLTKRGPDLAFAAAIVACVVLASREAYAMLEARGMRPLRGLGLALGAAVAASFAGPATELEPATALGLAVAATFVAAMAIRPEPQAMLDAALATILPIVLIAFPMGFLAALRLIDREMGPDLVLLLLLCVMLGDTAAYYTGRAFGKHRMAPSISPKKTWEGAAGALFGSLVAAALAHTWFFQRLTIVHAVALAVILCVVGVLGDLAESMLKRASGVKDASSLLPGHGGLFDRIDSLLFAGPALYGYWRIFLEGRL